MTGPVHSKGEAKLKNLTIAADKAEKSAKKRGASANASSAQIKRATKQVENLAMALRSAASIAPTFHRSS